MKSVNSIPACWLIPDWVFIIIFTQRGHVLEENEAGVVVNARQIGSRPPRCESRCSACGHCVAVQVPVSPQVQGHSKIRSHGSLPASTRTSPKNVAYCRGDDITNYKPISWKCKCGDLLFNPWLFLIQVLAHPCLIFHYLVNNNYELLEEKKNRKTFICTLLWWFLPFFFLWVLGIFGVNVFCTEITVAYFSIFCNWIFSYSFIGRFSGKYFILCYRLFIYF